MRTARPFGVCGLAGIYLAYRRTTYDIARTVKRLIGVRCATVRYVSLHPLQRERDRWGGTPWAARSSMHTFSAFVMASGH